MADKPQLLGYSSLLGDPPPAPSKWDRIKQALWETNLAAPIRGYYNLRNADPYTLYTDTGAAGQQLAADSFDAAGGITVGSMPMPKPANSLTMGIKAYHGSPHSFDKFSMDKIGTGEGAQAYGHGLYFAENEGVAKGYKEALKNKALIDPNADMLDPKRIAGELYDSWQGDIDGALSDAKSYDNSRAIIAELNKIRANPPGGSMYEVSINADPNAFLDWDKPLSEQPEAVRRLAGWTPETEAQYKAALKSDTDSLYNALVGDSQYSPAKMPRPAGSVPFDSTGERLYQSLTDRMGAIDWPDNATADVRAQYRKSASERAAEKLKEAGIPGIKYLDAGSRGAGDGTRNYVVFDDKLISIVRKYGIAGASAMLGYSVLDGATKAQAAELEKANAQYHGSNLGGGGW